MKFKLILLMAFISSIIARDTNSSYSKDYLKPYIGLEYNVFAIDKLSSDNRSVGMNVGVILQDQNRVELSYFIGHESSPDKKYYVKSIDLSYGYSFNNHGMHKGYIIDLGLVSNTLDKTTYSTDSNGTKIPSVDHDKSLNIVLGLGYEYLIDSNFMLTIEHKLSLLPINLDRTARRLVNTKFSVKYIFD